MAEEQKQRETFTGRFGIIAAAAGSAIGLGNIWKFPYITGVYGGAAFIVVYLICIALIGVPVMLSEFVLGRSTRRNPIGAFLKLAPSTPWRFAGWMGVLSAFLILAFYSVVAGWTLEYILKSFGGVFTGRSPDEIRLIYESFVSSPLRPLLWQLVFLALTAGIVISGVRKGIEQYSKILMPLLFVIILILDIRALTLRGAGEGLSFLFKPDFTKLSAAAVLSALGHAFFTLSLGMGAMITYGSYIGEKESLGATAIEVTVADTVIALLAGIAIFPAVFAFGIEPEAGPGLVFVTLPNVFQQIPLGNLVSFLFFLLLAVAALTSAISILEVVTAALIEQRDISRRTAVAIAAGGSLILSIPVSLSNGIASEFTVGGLTIFDFIDFLTANIMLPLGGLLIVLFVGWRWNRLELRREFEAGTLNGAGWYPLYRFVTRYLAPVGILFVFLNGVGIIYF